MTDSDPSPKSLLKLPLRKFEHFRVTTRDAPPTPLVVLEEHSTTASSSSSCRPCQVCHQHASRYTCPRCELPYCSVDCYKNHCQENNNTNESNGSNNCTEAFYHDRVTDILQLEQKAKVQDTKALINRLHNQQQKQHYHDGEDEEEEDENEEMSLSEENMSQLLELLSLLESSDGRDDDDDNDDGRQQQRQQQEQHLASLLNQFPKLKASFEKSLEQGEIQKLVLKPWSPWWKSQRVVVPKTSLEETYDKDGDIIFANDTNSSASMINTLDERLLQIPSLEQLQGGGGKTMKQQRPNFINLSYNLLELLYHIAGVLRLYYGVTNATSDGETAVDAATTLLHNSTVLSQDTIRYDSLEEVMLAIVTTRRTNNNTTNNNSNNSKNKSHENASFNHLPWTLLAEDTACLLSNPRMIGRALLEAVDIFKAATSYLHKQQKQKPKPKQKQNKEENSITTSSSLVSLLRRKRKKIEYFLSWSQTTTSACSSRSSSSATTTTTCMIPDHLSDDIRAWVEHWKYPPPNEMAEEEETELETLVLPSSSSSSFSRRPTNKNNNNKNDNNNKNRKDEELLLEEVESKSKPMAI